ncbi:MAG TPA: hypothetical protein VF018_01050 [Acidobacteriaceae bacterium]
MITSMLSFFALKGEGGQWHHVATGSCTTKDMERMWGELSIDPEELASGVWYEVWQVDGGKVHIMAPSARTA